MKKTFNIFRHIGWIAIICSTLGSFLLFVVGATKTYAAFAVVFLGKVPHKSLAHLDTADIATSYLIKSLDTFLNVTHRHFTVKSWVEVSESGRR